MGLKGLVCYVTVKIKGVTVRVNKITESAITTEFTINPRNSGVLQFLFSLPRFTLGAGLIVCLPISLNNIILNKFLFFDNNHFLTVAFLLGALSFSKYTRLQVIVR